MTLPNFNLSASAWNNPKKPSTDPADVIGKDVQLYVPSRGVLDILPGGPLNWVPPIYLRIASTGPALTPAVWIWEVITGSAQYYRVRWKQVIHQGFPNEYVAHLVEQCDSAGIAILRDVPGAGP
jgi:hypothetical protein